MADQVFSVKAGFFDSVNHDRLYTADEMNNPYSRIISDGVYANSDGSPSSDLQVLENSGMTIKVAPGGGLFAGKWFKNVGDLAITIPANTTAFGRIDSVIVQIDSRVSGRVGNIVYRTGTPSGSPVAPDLDNSTEGVTEYRLANVAVAAGASSITQSNITDKRGSSECPFAMLNIYQVLSVGGTDISSIVNSIS